MAGPGATRLRRGPVAALLVAVAACSTSTPTATPSTEATPTGNPGLALPTLPASPAAGSTAGSESGPSPTPTVRVVMAGDVLLHNGLWDVARHDARKAGRPPGSTDFGPMFRPVRPLLSGADLAICHLETPLGRTRGPFHDYPLFEVPPQVVDGLGAAGFDVCSTASNHSLDQGHEGLRRTLRALDARGMPHVGTARSPDERGTTTILDVKGVRVAVLSHTYGTNGIPVPPSKPWSVNLIEPARIREDARRAKAAGADAVLVALHWGTEYQHEPTDDQRRIARQVTRSPDVDLVYGHHAHVVQPVRKINGTWVAFGLGNFVAQQDPAITGVYDGAVAQFDIARRAPGTVSVRYAGYRPTYISRYESADPAMRVLDIDRALERGHRPASLRREMVDARRRVSEVMGPRPAPGR
jgi:hypothetical protein